MRAKKKKRNLKLLILIAVVFAVVVGISYALYAYSTTSRVQTGSIAPDIPLTLINGTTTDLNHFRGHPVILWFVTTWCPSCQEGAALISQKYLPQLVSMSVTMVAVESYNNLGYPGPTMDQFMNVYAGGGGQNWFFATTTKDATLIYNPDSYLDLYYLIDSNGLVVQTGTNLPGALPQIVSTRW